MDCKEKDVCYWGLDPTFWIHRKMFIQTIFELKQSPSFKGYYKDGDRIITKVQIHGIIVSVDQREKLVNYKVDDGTGVISCCSWKDIIQDLFSLGQTVTVQAKITQYHNERQLTVDSISVEDDLNSESLFWLDVVHLSKTVYNTPFNVPDGCMVSTKNKAKKCALELMEKWSNNGKLCFSFNELCCDPEMQTQVKSTLTVSSGEICCSTNEKTLLREMLTQMEKEGFVFYQDSKRDIYEVITYQKHLQPAILKAIQDICKGCPHNGAHLSRIADVVRSSQNLGRVSCARVVDALERLVASSEVYQKSEQVYCVV